MTIEEMNQRKRELGYNNQMISELSGVPPTTVQKVLSGTTTSPRRATIEALTRALSSGSDSAPRSKAVRQIVDENKGEALYRQYRYADEATSPAGRLSLLKEAMAAYGVAEKKTYTVSDMLSLPETFRAELIDGQVYTMEAPTVRHQEILVELLFQLRLHIRSHKEGCKVFPAPIDVRLDRDDATLVEPDIIVVCHPESLTEKYCDGAPDLVIEILSPSTRSKDMYLKCGKYRAAGVKEFWIIDPDNQSVWIYDFANENYPQYYSFEDHIPVGISEGKCEIDFPEIKRNL